MTAPMRDIAVPNLPSRDFDATAAFYGGFGFTVTYRSSEWMILERGELRLEFFPFPDLDPSASAFRCCLRVADVEGLAAAIRHSGVVERRTGIPRVEPVESQPWGLRAGYLVDGDGTLLALIEQRRAS